MERHCRLQSTIPLLTVHQRDLVYSMISSHLKCEFAGGRRIVLVFISTHQRPVGQIHEMIESQYRQRSLAHQPTASCQHLRAVIILDENRRRSICSWFEYLGGSAAIFFAYFFFVFALFRQRRLISIEGDRRLEGSSAQHANVYLRSRRIHLRDIMEDHIGLPTQYTYRYRYV